MAPSSADQDTIALIRRLAEALRFPFVDPQAQSDMMAHNLTLADVADIVVDWIGAGGRVKPTVLPSYRGREGDPAYEMKPKINLVTWYVKVCVDEPGGPDEGLALLSVHPDHG